MAHIYSIEGIVPVVHPSAYVHPTAVLIGDVIIGRGCYVGPNASLRGDFGRIVIEDGSNIQDTCVAHSFPGMDTVVEADGHIGHGAVLHGCHTARNVMVGMNAVLMDGAYIGESSIVSAAAFVKSKERIPPRSLVVGVPGRVLRELTDEEIEWKSRGTAVYQELARRSRDSLREAEPLSEPEPDRRRTTPMHLATLYESRTR